MGLYVAPLDPEIHRFKRQFTCSPCTLRIQTQSSGRITPVKMPLGTGDFPGGAVCASSAGGQGWIPGQGTRSCMPQLNIPHATRK